MTRALIRFVVAEYARRRVGLTGGYDADTPKNRLALNDLLAELNGRGRTLKSSPISPARPACSSPA